MTPFVSRSECGLRAPTQIVGDIAVEGLTAHYGGASPWGAGPDRSSPARFMATADHARCGSIWRAWQAFHIDGRGWTDIAYSSGVCPHGWRFEGRGPGRRTGANGTNTGNDRSLATCYIAGGSDPLTGPAKAAFLDEADRFGTTLRWDHSDWKPTACAGDEIRGWEATGWAPPDLAPEPEEVDEEEPLMEIVRPTAGPDSGGLWLVRGNVRWRIPATAYVDALIADGVPSRTVSQASWDCIRNVTVLGTGPLTS